MIQETHEGNGAREIVINDLIGHDHSHGPTSKGETMCRMLRKGIVHDHKDLETRDLISKKSLTPEE